MGGLGLSELKDSLRMEYLWKLPNARSLVSGVYALMQAEGTASRVLYDGTTPDAESFAHDVLRTGSLPFMVHAGGVPVAFCWFNTIEGRSCRGHFVFFKSVWGHERSTIVGRFIFTHMLPLRDNCGYLFDTLLGLTPACNPLAWKTALLSGAVMVGVIPRGLYMAARGHSEDAVLVAVTRASLGLEMEVDTCE